MDEVQRMAAHAALDKMIREGYVNICTIDKILRMTGGIPSRRDYEILSMLHCINFRDIQPELLQRLPGLIKGVLNGGGLEFDVRPCHQISVVPYPERV